MDTALKLLFLATALSAGITKADEKSAEKSALEALNIGNNEFTAKFFSSVADLNRGTSVVMSAFSVLTPLAQLTFASEGDTHTELLKTIGFPNDEVTKNVFGVINKRFKSIKGVDLTMASRVYVGNNFELNPEFQNISRDVFDSDVKSLDFSHSDTAAKEINAWVEDKTNKKIKDLVSPDSFDSNTVTVLVNAIYFKGKWAVQFKPENTKERDFHVNKEQTIKLPFMYRQGDYLYGESQELDAKLLRLPYEGEEASMLIVLPNAVDGLAALQTKLQNPELLKKAVENMYTHDVEVYLPKFKIETTIDLKQVLEKIGAKRIFSPTTSQLTNLIRGGASVAISKAIQKAFIEVSEEGTEAAAANAPFSRIVNPTHCFDASKPFFFLTQATNNGQIINFGTFYGLRHVLLSDDYMALFKYCIDLKEYYYGDYTQLNTTRDYLEADFNIILNRNNLVNKYVDDEELVDLNIKF